jgi:hypothetical protein
MHRKQCCWIGPPQDRRAGLRKSRQWSLSTLPQPDNVPRGANVHVRSAGLNGPRRTRSKNAALQYFFSEAESIDLYGDCQSRRNPRQCWVSANRPLKAAPALAFRQCKIPEIHGTLHRARGQQASEDARLEANLCRGSGLPEWRNSPTIGTDH